MSSSPTPRTEVPAAQPGGPAKPDRAPLAYKVARALFRPITNVLTRKDWRGLDNLPSSGGFIVCANHVSYIDPLVVAPFLHDNGHPAYFLTKSSVFKVPIIGRWMMAGGQVPVERSSSHAEESLQGAVDALNRGGCIVIMPEGTLGRDPDLWPMVGKTGAARLALRTRCPVIPLGQWGAQELLPPYGRPRPLPIKTMRMQAGAPVDLSDLYDRDIDAGVLREATERIMSAITTQLEVLRGEPAPTLRWDRTQGKRVDPRAVVGADRQGASGEAAADTPPDKTASDSTETDAPSPASDRKIAGTPSS